MKQDISPPWILTTAILILGGFVISTPLSTEPSAEGRVWLVFLSLFFLLLTQWKNARANWEKAKTHLKQPHNYLLVAWIVCVFISAGMAPDSKQALMGSPWRQVGAFQLSLAAILFMIAQSVTLEYKQWQVLTAGFIAVFAITVLEAFGFRPLYLLPESFSYPAATFGHRGLLAGFYILVAGIALVKNNYAIFLISGLGIALCNNTSAIIGYVILALVWVYTHRKQRVTLLVYMSIAVFVFFGISNINTLCKSLNLSNCISTKNGKTDNIGSVNDRLLLWKASIKMFEERPAFGWGDSQYSSNWYYYLPLEERDYLLSRLLGATDSSTINGVFPTFSYVDSKGLRKSTTLDVIEPHNYAIQELQSHGLVGFGFLIFFLLSFLRHSPRASFALLGYGLYLLAWFPVFEVLPIAALLIGSLSRSCRVDNYRRLEPSSSISLD